MESPIDAANEQNSQLTIQTVMASHITAKLLIATVLTAAPVAYETIQPRPSYAQEYCNVTYRPQGDNNFSVRKNRFGKAEVMIKRGEYYDLKDHKTWAGNSGLVSFGPMNCQKASDFKKFILTWRTKGYSRFPYIRHGDIDSWFSRNEKSAAGIVTKLIEMLIN